MTPSNFKQALINVSGLSEDEFILGEVICTIMRNYSNPKIEDHSEIKDFLYLILQNYSHQIQETSSNLFDYRKSKRMLVEAILGKNKVKEIKHSVFYKKFMDRDKLYLSELKKEVGIRKFRKLKESIFESKEFLNFYEFINKNIELNNIERFKHILKNHPSFKHFLCQYQEMTNFG